MSRLEVRGPDRVDELLELVRSGDGLHDLTADELLLSCHERGGTVLAAPGVGAVAVAMGRGVDGELLASVRLVVVEPELVGDASHDARLRLLRAAEDWAVERSASRIVLGGGLPFSLWPGSAPDDPLVPIALGLGYRSGPPWSSYRVPVSFRADPPAGVVVRRAVHDVDVALVSVAASSLWPRRSDEIARALDHGTCHVAIATRSDGDDVIGLATHSIARAGWTGPLVVVEAWRRRGVGRALLGQVCRDLMIAEFEHAIVGDAMDAPAQEFLASVGAVADVSFSLVERALDPARVVVD